MNIRKLIIEDIRCFAGRQEFNIRPLTFLIGENSTGKSTVLGCLQTLSNFIRVENYSLNFNVEPYSLGAFADIARISKPRKKSFQLGVELRLEGQEETLEYSLTLTGKEKGSEPAIKIQRMLFSDGHEIFIEKSNQQDRSNELLRGDVQIEAIERSDGKEKFIIAADPSLLEISSFEWLPHLFFYIEEDKENSSSVKNKDELVSFIRNCEKTFFKKRSITRGLNIPETYSFAPIRSRPQRTYDPLKEDISPEGSEMPMVLMNMSRTSKEQWEQLKRRLIKFGESSGLFADIDVRKFAKSTINDPFQLQIKVRGPKVNLMNVGYGVNQILPILVRIFNTHRETTFLMQQPEVHLHPKGQAELSSLIIANQKHNYVVETHSDYMIDRARIEIMEGNIAPEDVSLIYLEPTGNHVKVHNVAFDKQANLLNVPASYRQFFLKESDRLLGLD